MKVFLGADHRGYEIKGRFKTFFEKLGYEVIDVNPTPLNPEDDYPAIAASLVKQVLLAEKNDQKGILVCGSGQGMIIAANRFKGIRACLCWNEAEARASRNDDDSNILCLSSDQIPFEKAQSVITTWLSTDFGAAARYIKRISELDQLGQ
jgi:ribose 5-phosphate isomerase B